MILRYASIARDHIYSFISRRIRNKVRKYFTAGIRGRAYLGLFDEKNRGRKSRDNVLLILVFVVFFFYRNCRSVL
jgi:hypothetical protein